MVMASDWGETWGLSANEALASGVPVILSNKCGCAEDLSSATKEAQVFEMGNVKQLAELIEDGRWQMADGDSAKIRRKNLMKVMRERFDAENTIATVKRLLV
jgi:glycosyltransferase involved in cell wall biosynthesis